MITITKWKTTLFFMLTSIPTTISVMQKLQFKNLPQFQEQKNKLDYASLKVFHAIIQVIFLLTPLTSLRASSFRTNPQNGHQQTHWTRIHLYPEILICWASLPNGKLRTGYPITHLDSTPLRIQI